MKILVFGFSVTAETGGFVERCAAICERKRPDLEVMKVAIGGLHLDYARHLLKDVVAKHKPDAIIMEIASSVYRLRRGTEEQIAEYTAGMAAAFSLCRETGMRCGILDLPQERIRDNDWMAEADDKFSQMYKVPLRRVPLDMSVLRDNVHPNEKGKDRYAQALFELVVEVADSAPDFSSVKAERSFGAYPVQDLDIHNGTFREFSRAGFVAPMLELPEGRPIGITLPEPVIVTGLIVLRGPTSGELRLMVGDKIDRCDCYDRFCYYERLGGALATPRLASGIAVVQASNLPAEELLKGEKDLGPRRGGITHIIYERRPD